MKKINQPLSVSFFCALILILSFLFFGCGTRKTDSNKQENQKQFLNIENSYVQSTKIILGSSFTYTPFDGLKPMIIDGKKYNNVVISNSQKKEITNYKTFKTFYNITKTITIEKTKIVEKKDYSIMWIGLFFVLCVFVFLWFYLKKV